MYQDVVVPCQWRGGRRLRDHAATSRDRIGSREGPGGVCRALCARRETDVIFNDILKGLTPIFVYTRILLGVRDTADVPLRLREAAAPRVRRGSGRGRDRRRPLRAAAAAAARVEVNSPC